MSKKYDVVAVVGKYTNNQGQEKAKYKTVGMVYEKNGKFGLMIDSPITLDDEGKVVKFFGLYEPKSQQQNEAPHSNDGFDDKLPF